MNSIDKQNKNQKQVNIFEFYTSLYALVKSIHVWNLKGKLWCLLIIFKVNIWLKYTYISILQSIDIYNQIINK